MQSVRPIMVPTAAAFGILAERTDLTSYNACNEDTSGNASTGWATTQGTTMQPLNQMCERVYRERQLGVESVLGKAVSALVGNDQWQAIMPFRLGYPTLEALPSPRRGLDKVIG